MVSILAYGYQCVSYTYKRSYKYSVLYLKAITKISYSLLHAFIASFLFSADAGHLQDKSMIVICLLFVFPFT